MPETHDLIIIGAGPAGLAAAIEASRVGVNPLLLDGALKPGGQYFRHHADAPITIGRRPYSLPQLLEIIGSSGIPMYLNQTVWGITQDKASSNYSVHVETNNGYGSKHLAKCIVLATGAYERVIPFSGWRLPGVMTCGASMILAETTQAVKGARAIVYGTGALLWPTAFKLAEAGAKVIALVENSPFPWHAWKGFSLLPGQGDRISEILKYLKKLSRQRTAVWWNSKVIAAEGQDRLERVTIRHGGKNWIKKFDVDYLFVTHGLTPAAQLALSAGADYVDKPGDNWGIVQRNDMLQTSLEGVFSVGDGVMIHGKDAAVLEGQLAANAAAIHLGLDVPLVAIQSLKKRLSREQRFGKWLNTTFPIPDHLMAGLNDEVTLCRCENVTIGTVRKLISSGVHSADMLKSMTRIGMGRCQGRFCSQNLAALLAEGKCGLDTQKLLLRPRIPVFPVSIQTLLDHEVQHDS